MLKVAFSRFPKYFSSAFAISCYFLSCILLYSQGLQAQAISKDKLPQEAFTLGLDQALPLDPKVSVGQFENGLRYYIRENKEPENRAELRLVVNVGSVLEDDNQVGLAHFLEHMAFNGTKNFEKQEIVKFMESIGMQFGPGINAFTGVDETVYQLQLPTDNPEYLETAFQILEDWATSMTLDEEEIDLERGVVIEEWRSRRGVQARMSEKQFPVLYQGSRYPERLPIGNPDNIKTFKPETLQEFYRDWYRPELMAVIAVGDFKSENIKGLIEKHFSPIQSSENPRERTEYTVPSHTETLYSISSDPELAATSVGIYHKFPNKYNWTVDGYKTNVIEMLYNNMFNQRLVEIIQKPNPPFLNASSTKRNEVRSLSSYVLTAVVEEGKTEAGLKALSIEAERVQRFGFTASELERQKTNLMRGIEQAYINRESRTSSSHAAEMIRSFLTGEHIPGMEFEFALYQRLLPEITLADANQVAKEWLQEDNRVVMFSAPEKDGLTNPTQEQLQVAMTAAATAAITPYQDTTADNTLVAEIPQGSKVVKAKQYDDGLVEWQLANGVTVLLKPTEFTKDQILFQAYSPGGTSLSSVEDITPANTAAQFIPAGGLANFSPIELQKKLTGKVVGSRVNFGEYEESLSGTASPKDLETLMQIIYLQMTAPRADQTMYMLLSNQMRQALQNRSSIPAAVFSDRLQKLAFQDHPRKQPPSIGSMDRVDLDKSLAFYKDRFSDASNFTFFFVGSIDLEAMQPLVETYLGALPNTGRKESWKDVGIRYFDDVVVETVKKGLEPQSQTVIMFNGKFKNVKDLKARTDLLVNNQILQTRLRNLLREQLGGTYSVQINTGFNAIPYDSYTIFINFGSDPVRVKELSEAVFIEIEKLKKSGPTEDELKDAQQFYLKEFETGSQQNPFWLTRLSESHRYGVANAKLNAYVASFPDIVNSVSAKSVKNAAKKYFSMKNYLHATLLPEDKLLPENKLLPEDKSDSPEANPEGGTQNEDATEQAG